MIFPDGFKHFLGSPNTAAFGAAQERNTGRNTVAFEKLQLFVVMGTKDLVCAINRCFGKDCEVCQTHHFMVRRTVQLIGVKPGAATATAMVHLEAFTIIRIDFKFLQCIGTGGTIHVIEMN